MAVHSHSQESASPSRTRAAASTSDGSAAPQRAAASSASSASWKRGVRNAGAGVVTNPTLEAARGSDISTRLRNSAGPLVRSHPDAGHGSARLRGPWPRGTPPASTTSSRRCDPASEFGVPRDDPRLLQDLVTNDRATWPWSCKRYRGGLPVTALPREWPPCRDGPGRARPDPLPLRGRRPRGGARGQADDPASARRAPRAAASRSSSTWPPAGSTAWRTACTGTTRSATRSCGSARRPRAATTTLVVTGVPWRTGWRYAERGYRHLLWDAGTVLSQVLALRRRPRDRGCGPASPTPRSPRLVGADRAARAAAGAGRAGGGRAGRGAGRRGGGGRGRRRAARAAARDRAPSARATTDALGAPWPPAAPPTASSPPASLDDVILRRGSTRRMDAARRRVPQATLRVPMAAAMRGIDVPHCVAVHGVDGARARPLPLARPRRAAAPRRPAPGAAPRLLGPGPRPRRRLRRRRRRRPRARSTTAGTARRSSPPGSSRAGCTSRPTRSASARPA